MNDSEIVRLRHLRASALKLRALADVLSGDRAATGGPLLSLVGCAAWRLIRTVSGRLRAHPFADFQKDASAVAIVRYGLMAKVSVFWVGGRLSASMRLEKHLKALERELDDVRALTWAADLNDALGRSQKEFRCLVNAIRQAARGNSGVSSVALSVCARATGDDWPFLTS